MSNEHLLHRSLLLISIVLIITYLIPVPAPGESTTLFINAGEIKQGELLIISTGESGIVKSNL